MSKKNALQKWFGVADKTVVITGVSGQLGLCYARAFLESGAKVAGLDLNASPGSEALLSEYPQHYFFKSADITDKASLDLYFNELSSVFPVPNVLINNAALDSPPSAPPEENGPFETYPADSWDRVMDVNLKGTYLCCQVFGSAMAQHNGGSIINVASIYGMLSPDQSLYDYRRQRGEVFYKPVAYSASKSGVLNLTRYLAVYWAKRKVRVNSLSIAGVFNNQEEDFLQAYCQRIPIGRMAEADEYAGAMLFLASEASRYMTGENMVIDGGWTAI